MRKLLICIPLILTLLLFPVTAFAAEGDTGTDGDFSWRELSDGTVEVTGYSITGPFDAVIPGTLSGRVVSAIGDGAFYMDAISSVTMPDSVTTISNQAFLNCNNLSSVTFGSGLRQIGTEAFGNTAIVSITLPDNLEAIGELAFFQCQDLASVVFGSGLKSIGNQAFISCRDLASVSFPDSLETIGMYAFSGCTGLSTVVLGGGLVSIGDNAFWSCPVSSPLTFPDSLQTIGASAFYECTGLTSVTFGSGLVSIGDEAFALTGIASAALPDSLKTIGVSAFGACASLESVTFGSGLESIGESAFVQTPIKAAIFPDSLKSIGDYAFLECASLDTLTFGSGIETIGQWAFSQCDCLTRVSLPESLTTLGSWSFYQCASLVKADIFNETVPLSAGVFLGSPMTEGVWGLTGSTAESTFGGIYPFHYLYTVSFDEAGGTAVDDAIVEEGNLAVQPADPERQNYIFKGWFRDLALADAWDFSGDTVDADLTLHAKWTPVLALAASPADCEIYAGGRITLTPNIAGGEWSFDASLLSRSGNVFTGLAVGTAHVTYTSPDEQTTSIDIVIGEATLPATGQDFTPALWLLALAVGAALAAVNSVRKKSRAGS